MTDPRFTPSHGLAGVAELRHELRTPVNHIVGYTEMLLEDVEDVGHPDWQEGLAAALSAARDALVIINESLPPTRQAAISAEELSALHDSLAQPRTRILDTLRDILESVTPETDDQFASDVRKILKAADRLGMLESLRREPETTDEAAPAPSYGTGDDATSALPRGAGRILVVDDLEENRDVLGRRLEREGYTVVHAENGRRALDLIAAEPFDLVLLDVMMPELDGFETLGHIKDNPTTRDIPVIMISAADDMANIVRCIKRGAEDFLPKPFDPVLLRARITASLEKKRFRDQEKEYLQQVNRVIAAAAAVESGAYETGELSGIARRADELGRLARVFDGMAGQVKAREARLRDQVHHLRREIEAARDSGEMQIPGLDFANLPAGQFGDRYEIRAVIGRGGMGVVYRAHDRELDEVVAIKTLRPELVSNEDLIERFKTEVRLARKISHRNVVRTHDFGEWMGVYYLTMEYVEGITLHDLLEQRQTLEISSTLALTRQLADCMAVAHEEGVVHRDLKPQNLLLDAEGMLKVMDFGVAKLAEGSTGTTEVGMMIGTPSYMSPEQLLGESIDARTDLYAVGVVMYECLTGKLPFEARSPVSLIAKVLNEDAVEPVTLNADIPPALSTLVMELLAKHRDERIPSATALAERLSRIG